MSTMELFESLEPAMKVANTSHYPVVAFTVYGTPQQRGSKVAIPLGKRGGGIQRRKNGSPIINVKDSNHENSQSWMQLVKYAAINAYGRDRELITDPIELSVRFYFNRPKGHYRTGRYAGKLKDSAPRIHAQSPDLAKLIRCLEDAITGAVWQDDRLVFRYSGDTARYWTDTQERAEVAIYCPKE